MQRRPPFRLYLVGCALFFCMAAIALHLFQIGRGDQLTAVSVRQGKYHLHLSLAEGVIYDRSLRRINQSEETIYAVVDPTPETAAAILTKIQDREAVAAQLQKSAPFVCILNEPAEPSEHLRILQGTQDRSSVLPAQHLLGYRQNGTGMAGIQEAYSAWLHDCDTEADITFTVSGRGEVLPGAESRTEISGQQGGGVVTTLDLDIQEITEAALQQIAPYAGAAVVLDCRSGEILASASVPVYDTASLADALSDPQSPFVNRACAAYNVGSVFKLVTAAAALENGFSPQYLHTCTGEIDIYGQIFRCHRHSGHGLLDMKNALISSCNPYFISLSQLLSAEALHETAAQLRFGEPILFADGFSAEGGYLPSVDELRIDAEKANFSFGQGKLLASPLQIAAMTACIANGGCYHAPQLISGLYKNGIFYPVNRDTEGEQVLQPETAEALRSMMTAVINESETSNGKPEHTSAGGKTSTAQTGRYAEDGTEYCHAWMTGFFPANAPRYAVTVFVENGGSGNQAAAPVFREIIDRMTD